MWQTQPDLFLLPLVWYFLTSSQKLPPLRKGNKTNEIVKALFRLLTCIHVLDFLAMSTDSGWGYSMGTEEGDLYTSQCCSGPAKVCSVITPTPAHHVINRADGGKQSWVFQCDGNPAVIQQPVIDTMWIQKTFGTVCCYQDQSSTDN